MLLCDGFFKTKLEHVAVLYEVKYYIGFFLFQCLFFASFIILYCDQQMHY